jgi:CarboxypepD_reg-like domain
MRQLLTQFLCFTTWTLSAQSGAISGKLVFEGEDLIGATVMVMQEQKLIKGTVTDLQGHFRIGLSEGMYDLKLTFTGCRPRYFRNLLVKCDSLLAIVADIEFLRDENMITCGRLEYVNLYRPDITSGGQTLFANQIYPQLPISSSQNVRRKKKNKEVAHEIRVKYLSL